MKTLLVARKTLLELVREPQMLGILLVLPLIFVFFSALTYAAELLVTHPVLVIGEGAHAEALIAELEAQRYADGRPALAVTHTTDRESAEAALTDRSATVLLTIAPSGAATIKGDAVYPRFIRASTLVNGVIRRYETRAAGLPEPVLVTARSIFPAGPQSEFDLYAPGMMIFALLMIIPQTAMLVAREIRWGTLRRMQLTRLSSWQLLGGISLAQMVIAVLQVAAVLGGSVALGFHVRGSFWLALLVGVVICFSAVGLGLIVACFSANDSEAANVGGTLTMLQVFLSGSFYQFPPLTLFTLAGHQIDLFDVFPATHGFMALQQVLTFGVGLREIGFRLGATALLSAGCFAVGVLLFQRRQMHHQA